jgi:hypothetical protein
LRFGKGPYSIRGRYISSFIFHSKKIKKLGIDFLSIFSFIADKQTKKTKNNEPVILRQLRFALHPDPVDQNFRLAGERLQRYPLLARRRRLVVPEQGVLGQYAQPLHQHLRLRTALRGGAAIAFFLNNGPIGV